ncbi:hypothetical protein PR202_ga00713 [Eleusine coracana subsp. coracana]|uniref:Uncharacterized protein n=1 Tax=Eleusine coracana subsp. coracana TaxID=191504 RepID=A0AAV5BEX7_ELECO|nr:hypothetical protein PR202_ga00713 [Eleusine coracana subsp. coracana]
MTERNQSDDVWEHGVNTYPGFIYKYCKCSKKGGDATRFKQHLAGRGGNMVSYDRVPPDVRAYYLRQLDRTADKKKERQRESLRREEIAAEGNVIYDVEDDNDDELHAHLVVQDDNLGELQRITGTSSLTQWERKMWVTHT